MTKTNKSLLTIAALSIVALTTYGACTYLQDGGYNKCTDNSQCASYTTPTPTTCTDNQSSTGAQPGTTKTNVVTLTTYTGGSCSGTGTTIGACSGGTSSPGGTQTNIDHYCQGCSS